MSVAFDEFGDEVPEGFEHQAFPRARDFIRTPDIAT
jgi:hypothetical protein